MKLEIIEILAVASYHYFAKIKLPDGDKNIHIPEYLYHYLKRNGVPTAQKLSAMKKKTSKNEN